jgi:hypothetical protein
MVFGSYRPVPDLDQARVLNGLHAPWPHANLYSVNPCFRLQVSLKPLKRLLLKSEK